MPAADETGYPEVDSFVTSVDLHILFDDNNETVFEPLELLAWISLLITIIIMTWPNENILSFFQSNQKPQKIIENCILHFSNNYLGGQHSRSLQAFGDELPGLARHTSALCWVMIGVILFRLIEGIERLENVGRSLSEISRLKHSISNLDGLMMWSKMLLVTSMLFIPILIDIPFITESIPIPLCHMLLESEQHLRNYLGNGNCNDSIYPYICRCSNLPRRICKPTKTTKLIQALVTNLAGVPSIVFGMFGLAIFVKQGGLGWGLGPSVLLQV